MTTMLTFEIITQGDRQLYEAFPFSGSEWGPDKECMDYCAQMAGTGFFQALHDGVTTEWVPPHEIKSVLCSVEEWEEEDE